MPIVCDVYSTIHLFDARFYAKIMTESHFMWLAHVRPAAELTITAPVQMTPFSVSLLGCCSKNLKKDVNSEIANLDSSVWTDICSCPPSHICRSKLLVKVWTDSDFLTAI
jgi:hypothetical protein